MQPCSNRRQAMAMLALDELDDRQAFELRSHLGTCAACRDYLAEIANVTSTLARLEPEADLPASDHFHRKVMARLRTEERSSAREFWGRMVQAGWWNWRIALPATAMAGVLLAVLAVQMPHRTASGPMQPHAPASAEVPTIEVQVSPTMASYQIAADESLQKFDDLLTQQARKPLPPAPLYTASTLTLGNGAD